MIIYIPPRRDELSGKEIIAIAILVIIGLVFCFYVMKEWVEIASPKELKFLTIGRDRKLTVRTFKLWMEIYLNDKRKYRKRE